MKALILLLLITGCCTAKKQPTLTSGVTYPHITFNNTIYGDTTPILFLGSSTHPIGTAPLKFTDGQPPIITLSDTVKLDTTFFILNVKRVLCEN